MSTHDTAIATFRPTPLASLDHSESATQHHSAFITDYGITTFKAGASPAFGQLPMENVGEQHSLSSKLGYITTDDIDGLA
jgi:hypothetical protein